MLVAMTDFVTGAPVEGSLDVRWIHGAKDGSRDPGPLVQVHAFDEHTYLLRQSKSVHYEAPFMYLLMGSDRAVLLDTGATAEAATFPLRDTVEDLLNRNPRPSSDGDSHVRPVDGISADR